MSNLEQMLVAPPGFVEFLLPYTTAIGLPHLAEVAHIAIFSFLVSIALQRLSSIACPILFPQTYPKIKAKSDDWVRLCFLSKWIASWIGVGTGGAVVDGVGM